MKPKPFSLLNHFAVPLKAGCPRMNRFATLCFCAAVVERSVYELSFSPQRCKMHSSPAIACPRASVAERGRCSRLTTKERGAHAEQHAAWQPNTIIAIH